MQRGFRYCHILPSHVEAFGQSPCSSNTSKTNTLQKPTELQRKARKRPALLPAWTAYQITSREGTKVAPHFCGLLVSRLLGALSQSHLQFQYWIFPTLVPYFGGFWLKRYQFAIISHYQNERPVIEKIVNNSYDANTHVTFLLLLLQLT